MKKLFKTFALIALTATTSLTASARDHEYKSNLVKETTFQVGMYSIASQDQVRLLMDKSEGAAVTVELKDASGTVLHKEVVNKKSTTYNRYFNIGDLENGTYTFVIKNGNESITKEIVKVSKTTQKIAIK